MVTKFNPNDSQYDLLKLSVFMVISYKFKNGKITTPIQIKIQMNSVSKPIKCMVSKFLKKARNINNKTKILSERYILFFVIILNQINTVFFNFD